VSLMGSFIMPLAAPENPVSLVCQNLTA
jgi:hypothetical protein